LRHDDILQRGEFRQQMMKLIDESDFSAAQPGALDVGLVRGSDAV
jgi:hypothetical protein